MEWKTVSEQKYSHFEIELAKGEIDFQNGNFVKIGEVISPGNSNAERTTALLIMKPLRWRYDITG